MTSDEKIREAVKEIVCCAYGAINYVNFGKESLLPSESKPCLGCYVRSAETEVERGGTNQSKGTKRYEVHIFTLHKIIKKKWVSVEGQKKDMAETSEMFYERINNVRENDVSLVESIHSILVDEMMKYWFRADSSIRWSDIDPKDMYEDCFGKQATFFLRINYNPPKANKHIDIDKLKAESKFYNKSRKNVSTTK